MENVPEAVLQYVNRLSDLLFIIARYLEKRDGKLTYKTKPVNPGC
jgi:cob(I)alamin adenosyltransferase